MLKKNKCLLFLLSILLIASCNKKDVEGREVTPASDSFTVTKDLVVSDDNPDFVAGPIFFTAEFSEEVTATIKLTGLESGASKEIIVDKASVLEAANTTWNGNHDGLYFFKTGEKVLYEMSFYGSDIVQRDTLIVDVAYDFIVDDVTVVVPNGDFEYLSGGGDWWLQGDVVALNTDATYPSSFLPVQGEQYIHAFGTRTAASSYIGGASQGARNGQFFDLPFDASRVWVNVYAYGYGSSNSHTNFILSFHEADSVGLTVPHDKNGLGTDDNMGWIVPMDHEGWKLLSIKYSDIAFPTYCVPGVEGGGCGNKVREPNRIDLISVSFESDEVLPSNGAIDFLMFTLDKPLDPSKF